MRFSDIDWQVLQGALITLVLALVLAGTLVSAAEWFSEKIVLRFDQQKRSLDIVRNTFNEVDNEKAVLDEFLPRYRALEQAGIVGDEQRLTWVEALRAVAEELAVPTLRYEIGPQVEVTPDFPIASGLHRILSSDLSLDMGLFHEGDLQRVLQSLERSGKGLLSVDACTLARTSSLYETDPRRPNMTAACTIRWYSVRLPDA